MRTILVKVTAAVLATLVVTSVLADQTIPVGPVGNSTWAEDEVITLVGSIQIIGDLVIEPGVEVLIPPGSIIAVQSTGSIRASGEAGREIHMHSSAANPMPGDWQTIFLMASADEGNLFRHVIIEHARTALTIVSVSPSIEHCTLRNLGSTDANDGIDGAPGTDGDEAIAIAGIAVGGGARPRIQNNLIELITGGRGGDGGNGAIGVDGMVGSVPGDPGDDGGPGWNGGNGGAGADVSGIRLDGGGTIAAISENIIRHLTGGDGGDGGLGGDGGDGGDGNLNAKGGDGSHGGAGGDGGVGGLAAGVWATNGAIAIVASNEITDLTGGNGGDGTVAGINGNGANGGDGIDGSTQPMITPGDGGDGGNGYPDLFDLTKGGGDAGAGGDAIGVFAENASLLVFANSIHDALSGNGGNGGRSTQGGNGGTGGRGGAGVGNTMAPGNGGDGGPGSPAVIPGAAGDAGASFGVFIDVSALTTSIQRNEIYALTGGMGGNGGEGGRGGDGGLGGAGGAGILPTVGGRGGDSREGSGRGGGSGGLAIGIGLISVSGAPIVSENRIHDLQGGDGGFPNDVSGPGEAGNGGGGTFGGDGGIGAPGTHGGGAGGAGGAVGVFAPMSNVETSNNIIWRLRGGAPGEANDSTAGADGGDAGQGLLSDGAGGDAGDGGFSGLGASGGTSVAFVDTSNMAVHYHETIADLSVDLAGTLPSPPSGGGTGGEGDPPGANGTPGTAALPPDPSDAIAVTASGTANSTLNNAIFWQPQPGGATGMRKGAIATVSSDFNIYFNIGTPVDGAALGGNDLLIDPVFANPASGDFRLRRVSPAIDSGTARMIERDIVNHPRPFDVPGRGAEATGVEFDRGAYEAITGSTGYQTWEIVEAILNDVMLSGPSDPLDVNRDQALDGADVVDNVNDVSAALNP